MKFFRNIFRLAVSLFIILSCIYYTRRCVFRGIAFYLRGFTFDLLFLYLVIQQKKVILKYNIHYSYGNLEGARITE